VTASRPGAAPADRAAPARDALLDAAIELIATGGLASATQRKIAAHAGVSLASTTYHFQTRDKLLEAALRQSAALTVAKLAELRDAVLAGDIPLLDACTAFIRQPPGRHRHSVLVIYELFVTAARNDHLQPAIPELIAALEEFFAPWTDPRAVYGVASAFFGLALFEIAQGAAANPEHLRNALERLFATFGIDAAVEASIHAAARQPPAEQRQSGLPFASTR
jgi:DNA-binding transcriptional regulator YbjK